MRWLAATLVFGTAMVALPATASSAAAPGRQLLVVSAPGADRVDRSDARLRAGVRFERRTAPGVDLVRVEGDPERAAATLAADPAVLHVESDRPIAATAVEAPDDPYWGYQWGLENTGTWGVLKPSLADADIDLLDAWETTRGAGAVVTVVDSGVQRTHPDLSGRLLSGWDYVADDSDPDDTNGHGTHVSGTIAAVSGNGIGTAGVAPLSQVVPLRVLDGSGNGVGSDSSAALADAAAAGARVVNASFGSDTYSAVEEQVIAAHPDTLFVTAAGNGGEDVDSEPTYPCTLDLDNVICVGASDPFDMPTLLSNRGRNSVDLFAPGGDIASTFLNGGYALMSGTSMAAPAVAGVAALIVSRHPTFTAVQLRRALLESVDRPPALRELSASGGRLNAAAALARADEIALDGPPPPAPANLRLAPGPFGASLTWDGPPAQISAYRVELAPAGGDFALATTTGSRAARLGGLVPGATYEVRVRAVDARQKVSAPSPTVEFSPQGEQPPPAAIADQDAAEPESPVAAPLPHKARLLAASLRGRARTGRRGAAKLVLRLSAKATVIVRLDRRVCRRNRCRWQASTTRSLRVRKGMNSFALRGRTRTAGRWRAVITAPGGRRTVTFIVLRAPRSAR